MRLYSGLVTSNPTASQLFFFSREEDQAGKGWVVFSIAELMKFFGKSRKTILNWSKSEIYFASREVKRDRLFLKYNSLRKIKGLVKIPFHASFEGNLETIQTIAKLKKAAYAAALNRQQKSCEYQLTKTLKSSSQIFNPTLERLQRSPGRVGCEYYLKEKGHVFVKKTKTPVGASQTTVAKKLGVSRQTVLRHTAEIPRLKIFKRVNIPKETPAYYYKFREKYIVKKTGKESTKLQVYRRMPNLYFFDQEVRRESTMKVVTPVDPAQDLLRAKQENADRINYIIGQLPGRKSDFRADLSKKKNQDSFIEKLYDLKPEQVLDFVGSLFLFLSDRLVPKEVLKTKPIPSLIEAVRMQFPSLEVVAFDFMKLMLNRLQKNKTAKPHSYWESYRKGIYPVADLR